jgi:hypothetical protein
MKTHPDEEYVSECCGGHQHGDSDICPLCYEHAEFVEVNRYYMNRPEPAQYSYAPTQKQITRWIKRIVFGRI